MATSEQDELRRRIARAQETHDRIKAKVPGNENFDKWSEDEWAMQNACHYVGVQIKAWQREDEALERKRKAKAARRKEAELRADKLIDQMAERIAIKAAREKVAKTTPPDPNAPSNLERDFKRLNAEQRAEIGALLDKFLE